MSQPYPSLQTLRTGSAERLSGHEPQRATNGTLKVRRLATTEKTNFQLEHLLTADQRTTLEAFYQANKDGNVALTGPEDGGSYITRFVGAPQYRRLGQRWHARVLLNEV